MAALPLLREKEQESECFNFLLPRIRDNICMGRIPSPEENFA